MIALQALAPVGVMTHLTRAIQWLKCDTALILTVSCDLAQVTRIKDRDTVPKTSNSTESKEARKQRANG